MADNSKVIDSFTLMPSLEFSRFNVKNAAQPVENYAVQGQRINKYAGQYHKNYFYFQVPVKDDKFKLFLNNVKQRFPMNIRFHENRTTFLAQHLALYYMKKHNLVNCLINHEFYARNMPENPIDLHTHYF